MQLREEEKAENFVPFSCVPERGRNKRQKKVVEVRFSHFL
jgi:hypothetical protein